LEPNPLRYSYLLVNEMGEHVGGRVYAQTLEDSLALVAESTGGADLRDLKGLVSAVAEDIGWDGMVYAPFEAAGKTWALDLDIDGHKPIKIIPPPDYVGPTRMWWSWAAAGGDIGMRQYAEMHGSAAKIMPSGILVVFHRGFARGETMNPIEIRQESKTTAELLAVPVKYTAKQQAAIDRKRSSVLHGSDKPRKRVLTPGKDRK